MAKWRAKKGDLYWVVLTTCYGEFWTVRKIDQREKTDLINYKAGNYFKTELEAVGLLNKVKQLLKDGGK